VGVQGYDPIQGALAPPLRLTAHISAVLFLWAVSLLVWPYFMALTVAADGTSIHHCRTGNVPDVVWVTAAAAVAVYSAHFYVLFHVLSGVSLPCGPRPHKITRTPAWKNRLVSLPVDIAGKFRCAYAADSHEVSRTVFQGTGATLTGEPAGRDVWTGTPKTKSQQQQQGSQNTRVDERLVQEMASGGRAAGFNPAVNPNRYVRYIVVALYRHCIILYGTEYPAVQRVRTVA
jgi:hypothetical protein